MSFSAPLAVAYAISQFFRASFAILGVAMVADGAPEAGALTLTSAAFFIGLATGLPIVGLALDRIGNSLVCSMFLPVAAVGATVLALDGSATSLILARGLIGFGCSPIFMTVLHRDGTIADSRMGAASSALYFFVGNLGLVAATLPLSVAVEQWGWQAPMVAATAIVLFVHAWMVASASHGEARITQERAGLDRALGKAHMPTGAHPQFADIQLLVVSFAVVSSVTTFWIGPFLNGAFSMPLRAIGVIFFLVALCGAAGPLIAHVIARFSAIPAPAIVSIYVVLGLGAFAGLGHGAPAPDRAVALLCLLAFSSGHLAFLWSDIRKRLHPSRLGSGIAGVNAIAMMAVAAAQLGFNEVLKVSDVEAGAYRNGFLALAALWSFSLILYLGLNRQAGASRHSAPRTPTLRAQSCSLETFASADELPSGTARLRGS